MLFDSAIEKQEELKKDFQAEAKRKEDEQKTVQEMRASAMEHLGNKKRPSSTSSQSDGNSPSQKVSRMSIADVVEKRQKERRVQRGEAMQLQLKHRDRELQLQEAKFDENKKEAERWASLEEAKLEEQARAARAKEEYDRKMLEILLKRN